MKKKILLGSSFLTVSAMVLALINAVFVTSPETLVRSGAASWILVLGSVGLWAVGLVFPRD